LYSDSVKTAIETIRPGLTGIGSVVFRDEESILDKVSGDRDEFHDTVITPYKGELEVWYTQHRNGWTYAALIALTILAVLRPSSDAYQRFFKDLPAPPERLERLI
jgi:lipopolysaccharide/colanic/teichoic acid biosynthesis glycosyltransferase